MCPLSNIPEEKEWNLRELEDMVLAPYIWKATALIGRKRRVGGNQFRHNMATLAILIDYHYTHDPVLLKASIIHDLYEDVPNTDRNDIRALVDGIEVDNLVVEMTRSKTEKKSVYLSRILNQGSKRAKILKVADRISNLTDLHLGIDNETMILGYLNETRQLIFPMAEEVNTNMLLELTDLCNRREKYLNLILKH